MKIATVSDYWLNEQAKDADKGLQVKIEYAWVIQLTHQGEPIIQFDGHSLPSQKTYRRMRHYSPQIGDRVQLINGVIIGGWKP